MTREDKQSTEPPPDAEVAFRDGDRVYDKFKLPKPGDECVTGTIVGEPTHGNVTVKWDAPVELNQTTTVTNVRCLEKLEKPT
jgi:hypothetical protein